MRLRAVLVAAALLSTAVVAPAAAEDFGISVSFIPPPPQIAPPAADVPEPLAPVPIPEAVIPIPPTPVQILAYIRALPAETLIRIAWHGTGQEERALKIARRESGLRCDAKNPRSSASGLFQHLRLHEARARRMGFTWAEVAGPDCYADVMLAKQMYDESGWRAWRLTA